MTDYRKVLLVMILAKKGLGIELILDLVLIFEQTPNMKESSLVQAHHTIQVLHRCLMKALFIN